jgi:hypothetical protein
MKFAALSNASQPLKNDFHAFFRHSRVDGYPGFSERSWISLCTTMTNASTAGDFFNKQLGLRTVFRSSG